MADVGSITAEIRNLEFDSLSAQRWAREGRIEDWVHKYLLYGRGGKSNVEFSAGLKRERRWWIGPIELNLADLSPVVGPDPDMEFVVRENYWHTWISNIAQSLSYPGSVPPLIVEYRSGELSVRDGNKRLGAMNSLGWPKCWVIIWYNSENDYLQHSKALGHPCVDHVTNLEV